MEALRWGQYGKADALARAGRTEEAKSPIERGGTASFARSLGDGSRATRCWASSASRRPTMAGARDALEKSRRVVRANILLIRVRRPDLSASRREPARTSLGRSRAARAGPVARQAWRESRFARFIGWRVPELPAACPARQRPCRLRPRQDEEGGRLLRASRSSRPRTRAHRYDLARALLDASRVIPERADEYRRRGQQLLDELGAVVPEAERLPS